VTDLAPAVSVIIVNWNGRQHLPTCLDSLAGQTFRDFEAIVVDNGSTDGSLELVRERYPWVRLVTLPENTGFATGNNRGLAQARGTYLVTLNNDTRAEPDWLATLVGVADAHPQAGMVGCRICSFDDPDIIDSIGVGICRDGMSRGRYRNRRWSELRLAEVEAALFPSACAALYRRAMLDEIGVFDDEFFAYVEDSDLGLRGRLAGWQAVIATRAVVRHKYSRTGGVLSPLKVYLVERNHYWLAVKTFPLPWLLATPLFTVGRYGEQLRAVLAGQGTGGQLRASNSGGAVIWAILRGTCAALAGVPRMLGKRRRIMTTRRIPAQRMAELLRAYRLSFRELLDRA
jgi:GT2 family glycosyltransferase